MPNAIRGTCLAITRLSWLILRQDLPLLVPQAFPAVLMHKRVWMAPFPSPIANVLRGFTAPTLAAPRAKYAPSAQIVHISGPSSPHWRYVRATGALQTHRKICTSARSMPSALAMVRLVRLAHQASTRVWRTARNAIASRTTTLMLQAGNVTHAQTAATWFYTFPWDGLASHCRCAWPIGADGTGLRGSQCLAIAAGSRQLEPHSQAN